MLDTIREKIRALIVDNSKNGFQTFIYTTTNIFTIAQTNIDILKVLLDGNEIDDYSFDEDTNKITITASSIGTSSVIEVDYTYTKYSDTELNGYIKSALVWINVYTNNDYDYEFEEESAETIIVVPSATDLPDNKTQDLIALIASILIKPDYSQYNLPNLKVVYPRKMTKEERIEKLIAKFNIGIGLNEVIQFDIFPFDQFPYTI